MEGEVKWVNFRARRPMNEEELQIEAASSQLRDAIAHTINDLSKAPLDVASITSRKELITKAADGLVTMDIMEEPGAQSEFLPEQTLHIYMNVNAVLEALDEDEIKLAVQQADRMLEI